MGKNVFINGMEISHKAGDGIVIAAFPDVCLSPPAPPAGPVPIPYPDTSKASNLQDGTTSVTVGGKPAALFGKSSFKSSPLGNEAATRTFGANVITHEITGKTYFQACSMNVTFDGKPVCRHLDVMTSNHLGAQPGGTPPMPEMEKMDLGGPDGNGGEEDEEKEEKCPCCGEPKHPNQQDAEPVSEEKWYCVDRETEVALQAEIDALEAKYPRDPNRRGEKKEVFEAKKRARARKDAFDERKATLKEMRDLGCPSLPTPPGQGCGTYFKQTDPKKRQAAEKRWQEPKDGYKAVYKRWRKSKGRPLAEGEKVNHVVPMGAGGCPKGGREEEGYPNLVPDGDIQNARCLELDGPKNPRLGRAQSQAFSHWAGDKG